MTSCYSTITPYFGECKEPTNLPSILDAIPENSTWAIASKRSDPILKIECILPHPMSMTFNIEPKHLQKMFDDFEGKEMTYKNREFKTFDGKVMGLK